MNGLTQAMIDAARASPAGQYIDRLIAEDVERTGGQGFGGPIIQQIWDAMKAVAPKDGHLPEWAQAAMTPASAQVTVVGNTPTIGGKFTSKDYDNWLATIPEPIEPGQ